MMMRKDIHAMVGQTIPRRFETIAAMHGGHTAVQTDAVVLTYDALNALANRMSNAINSRMTRSTAKGAVGVFMRPGAMLPAAILAVLKSGNYYVPLDPAHPAERNAYIVSDSGAAVLLTECNDLSAAKAIVSISRRDIQIKGVVG